MKYQSHLLIALACFLASSLCVSTAEATSLAQKILVRRQSGETEKESTSNSNNNGNGGGAMQPPARLYPDLPQQPGSAMYPPGYPAVGPQGAFQPNFHGAPTPFVPFSPQLSPSQLSDLQRRMQQQQPMGGRPMTSAERLQSQSFTSGLGRRLLAMIGLQSGDDKEAASSGNNETSPGAEAPTMDPAMIQRALQNATVLQQLNGGVQSIYGSLSRMYNSTVQQQLQLLQERFKKEAENSSSTLNAWQQRMSQQVPMFFRNMAAKVGEAQENLNRIWQQTVAQASGNGTTTTPVESRSSTNQNSAQMQPPQGGLLSSIDRFMNPNAAGADMFSGAGGNFFDQFGRSLGFGNQQQPAAGTGGQGQDLGSQLMSFWHQQVQPQIGMVRGQIARVWRDLTASGALAMSSSDPMVLRSRNQFNQLGSAAPASSGESSSSSSSSELVDEILKEVDMNNAEYTLLDPSANSSSGDQQPQRPASQIGSQMQNRLITMQREINQLWSGLTGSLQNAIGNVRSTLNPPARQTFGMMTPMASSDSKQEVDPEENEIGGKVKDLAKLQREADTLHDALRQQQQQQQQKPAFGDRFRSFFNNMDLANEFNQLPTRFGDSINRFGTAVGDLWNQIPRRWDNFVENMSPQSEMARARLVAAAASDKTTTTTTTTTNKPVA